MIQELSEKHRRSKEHTQQYRPYFALNRNAAGFQMANKEITYTLVSDRSEGPYVYDLDGHQYIDLTMGFGSILFGHNYAPIREAIETQLQKSWSVGPISPLAGQLSKEISKMCGVERVGFFNSGTEAVMVAMRMAKAATKKNYIVFFKGSYHGTFDSLLSMREEPDTKIAREVVPGVTQSILNESFLLDFGTESSLEFIATHKDQIAAVLTEPIQSRNPGRQDANYLKQLRELTKAYDIALIFDEVITGFRIDMGGAQRYFNIDADIVCYGKVIGGGLPIGIVAGKSCFLDTLDGGYWSYGDESVPAVKQTFVAGTFCHHPLAMAASLKVIELLKASSGKILCELNQRTDAFCTRMNQYFASKAIRIQIDHFASLFRFTTPGRHKQLYPRLLLNGVYIWEGRNCFLSLSHTPEIVHALEEKIKMSCEELVQMGLIKQKA